MNFDALWDTLPVMVKGMAGIFMVTGFIIAATLLLNRFAKPEEPGKEP